jgi:two-component system nitrogen regulation sensor histidine kinase NtrY
MLRFRESQRSDLKRRRRETIIIAFLLLVIATLTTYLFLRRFSLGLDIPVLNSILVFALVDINVILLLLLLFLTTRNSVKLLFERRRGIMGAKLRTKLVLAFITLSLLPTIALFFVSVQFISSSVESWFNLPVEKALMNSLEVGRGYYSRISDEMLSFGNDLSRLITYQGSRSCPERRTGKLITEKRAEHVLPPSRCCRRPQTRAFSQDKAWTSAPSRTWHRYPSKKPRDGFL